jgi:hypothetical protein
MEEVRQQRHVAPNTCWLLCTSVATTIGGKRHDVLCRLHILHGKPLRER